MCEYKFDIIIDDGSPTSIAFKGDGVKSLAALGLLKDRKKRSGSSIIAIEEPELRAEYFRMMEAQL